MSLLDEEDKRTNTRFVVPFSVGRSHMASRRAHQADGPNGLTTKEFFEYH